MSTPELFPQVIKIARILGPKGLMPSPGRGTVSNDIEGMMKSLSATTKYEMDSNAIVCLRKITFIFSLDI